MPTPVSQPPPLVLLSSWFRCPCRTRGHSSHLGCTLKSPEEFKKNTKVWIPQETLPSLAPGVRAVGHWDFKCPQGGSPVQPGVEDPQVGEPFVLSPSCSGHHILRPPLVWLFTPLLTATLDRLTSDNGRTAILPVPSTLFSKQPSVFLDLSPP